MVDSAELTDSLSKRLTEKIGLLRLVGESPAFLKSIQRLSLLAKSDATVFLQGETGTGKEVCARALHYLSQRSDKPFVPVDCGAIPIELVENELFGHERSAFTGATSGQHGLVREAEGGSLFLDEVDCLPVKAQTKLLRLLQEKEYRPLGTTKMRTANIRFIAASNADLEECKDQGRLRQDLYYRLNVFSLRLPPLRERQGDVVLLAKHFLLKHAKEHGRPAPQLSSNAEQALLAYDWPGNVRELGNLMERALVLSDGRAVIGVNEIELPLSTHPGPESFQAAKARMIVDFETSYIENLLRIHHGNISSAAQAAQKNRRAFWELMRKHDIDAARFR